MKPKTIRKSGRPLLSALQALFVLSMMSAWVTGAECPGGASIVVSHVSRGRSDEVSKKLATWIDKVADRALATRLQDAFLGRICENDDALLDELGRMSRDGCVLVRAEAVKVLSFVPEDKAIRFVRASLHDRAAVVRLRALEGVDYVCDKSALPEVEDLVKAEKDAQVLRYAEQVLDRLRGKHPCSPLPWMESSPPKGAPGRASE